MRKMLTWYGILHKRLLKKPGFLVILAAIVLLTVLMTVASRGASGFLHVALATGDDDPAAAAVVTRLTGEDSILRFTVCDTPEDAVELVKSAKADTAWVLAADFADRVAQVADGKSATLVAVYAVEDSSFIRSAREKLYGAMFPAISYEVYARHVRQALPDGTVLDEATLRATYARYAVEDGIVDFAFLDSAQPSLDDTHYLTSPLRGLFMAMMLFCGLAATMVFKNDEKERVFSTLSVGKRLAVFFANNLAALSIAAAFVTAALVLSGLYTDVWRESVMMGLFILAAAGFCTLVGAACPSNTALGAVLPVALVASVALCPVFFNLRVGVLRLVMPGYYYLYGVNDLGYVWPMLAYIAVVYALAATVYIPAKRRE